MRRKKRDTLNNRLESRKGRTSNSMKELRELKGLGKARLDTLQKAGIETMADLLLTLPIRYQDTSTVTPLGRAVLVIQPMRILVEERSYWIRIQPFSLPNT